MLKFLESIRWPLDGICFDIKHNGYWRSDWGEKPKGLEDAFGVARQKVAEAPLLIPIYSHRYIPDNPCMAGNPIFSVYQTDIIYYGSDLKNYLENEFHYFFNTPKYHISEPIRRIEFWSLLVEENG